MSEEDVKTGSDCGCESGGCCGGGKSGWRGSLGLIVTVVILVAAGLVVVRGLVNDTDSNAASPGPAAVAGSR